MSEFRALQAPAEGGMGWYVSTVEDSEKSFGWLTTSGTISGNTDNLDVLFFKTEGEARSAMVVYYNSHFQKLEDEIIETDTSRVMEFE